MTAMSLNNESESYTRRKAKSSLAAKLAASQGSPDRNSMEGSLIRNGGTGNYNRQNLISLSAGDHGYSQQNNRMLLRPRDIDDDNLDYRRRSKSQSPSVYSSRSSGSVSDRRENIRRDLDSESDDSDFDSSRLPVGRRRISLNGHTLLQRVDVESDEEGHDYPHSSDLRLSNSPLRSSTSQYHSNSRDYRQDSSDRARATSLPHLSYTAPQLNGYRDDVERYRQKIERDLDDESRDVVASLNRRNERVQLFRHSPNPTVGTSSNFQSVGARSEFNRTYSDSGASERSGLTQISTKEARTRSFLVGSMTAGGPLLGVEELQRYFPERKMRLFVGTYNLGEMREPPSSLDDFILPETSDVTQDMYIIGAQEAVTNFTSQWELSIQETLGPQYVMYHSASHGTLHIVMFIRRDLIWYTSVPEEAFVTTRIGPSSIRTKGAIGISFQFFGSSFLFINCHLTAHDGKSQERIEDYKKIIAGLNFSKAANKSSSNPGADITAEYDCVFWMGDLNCRIEKDREYVETLLNRIESEKHPDFGLADYSPLLNYDELKRVMDNGLAFSEFIEGRIKFRPTFKYNENSADFDTSAKNRIPSYTDRILYRTRTKNAAACLVYDTALSIHKSDHRPVYGVYDVSLKPAVDSVPLSGGQFNKSVWLEGNKRRTQKGGDVKSRPLLKGTKDRTSSSICVVM